MSVSKMIRVRSCFGYSLRKGCSIALIYNLVFFIMTLYILNEHVWWPKIANGHWNDLSAWNVLMTFSNLVAIWFTVLALCGLHKDRPAQMVHYVYVALVPIAFTIYDMAFGEHSFFHGGLQESISGAIFMVFLSIVEVYSWMVVYSQYCELEELYRFMGFVTV